MGKATKHYDPLTLAEIASLPAVVTSDVAAAVMGTSRNFVYDRFADGTLEGFKPGGERAGVEVRILTRSLLEFCGLTKDIAEVRHVLDVPRGPGSWCGRVYTDASGVNGRYVEGGKSGKSTGRVMLRPRRRAGEVAEDASENAPEATGDLPEEITLTEAVRLTGKSRATIQQRIDRGQVSARKREGKWFLDKRDVMAEFRQEDDDTDVLAATLPETISLEQAISLSGVSRRTFYRRMEAGLLVPTRSEKPLRFDKRDVLETFSAGSR